MSRDLEEQEAEMRFYAAQRARAIHMASTGNYGNIGAVLEEMLDDVSECARGRVSINSAYEKVHGLVSELVIGQQWLRDRISASEVAP